MLQLVQWNCQSLKNKIPELEFRSQKTHILLLAETWLNSQDRVNIRNFDTVRKDRKIGIGRGGGVAILVNNSIKYSHVNINYDCNGKIECCAIQIKYDNRPVILASIYKPPENKISTQEWLLFFKQFQCDFIVGGDFNAHHTQWGNPKNCPQGDNLREAYIQLDLCLLNDGTHTYRPYWRSTSSAIDLTFASNRLVGSISWGVGEENWGGDHAHIDICLAGKITYSSKYKISNRPYSTKSDWIKINSNFCAQEESLVELVDDERIETQTKFMLSIRDCIEDGTPGKRNSNKKSTGTKK